MSLPKKFSTIPLESHGYTDSLSDVSDECVTRLMEKLEDRVIVAQGVLSYTSVLRNFQVMILTIHSFKSTRALPLTRTFLPWNMKEFNSTGELTRLLSCVPVPGFTQGKVYQFANGSNVYFPPGVPMHSQLLLLPCPFNPSDTTRFKKGDEVTCPVLEHLENTKFPSKSKMAKPLVIPGKTNYSSYELIVYKEPCTIISLFKKERYARVRTPDGDRYYHLSCLIKPLELIPYL